MAISRRTALLFLRSVLVALFAYVLLVVVVAHIGAWFLGVATQALFPTFPDRWVPYVRGGFRGAVWLSLGATLPWWSARVDLAVRWAVARLRRRGAES
jgi:hypothetical protein